MDDLYPQREELKDMAVHALTQRISYFPAASDPLSADIGMIRGDAFTWFFDVGSSDAAADFIQGSDAPHKIILSHFHADHTRNLSRVTYSQLYCGDFTYSKFHKGTVIREPLTIIDGVKLTLFPIASPHSKGAIGLEVDDAYAFLGDALYGADKKGRMAYNITKLKEMITTLEGLKASRFLISHDPVYVRSRQAVIAELKALYAMRKPGEAFIFADE